MRCAALPCRAVRGAVLRRWRRVAADDPTHADDVLRWWVDLLGWAVEADKDHASGAGDVVPVRHRVASLLLWNPAEVVRVACENADWLRMIRTVQGMPQRASAAQMVRFVAGMKHPLWRVESERLPATVVVCASLDRVFTRQPTAGDRPWQVSTPLHVCTLCDEWRTACWHIAVVSPTARDRVICTYPGARVRVEPPSKDIRGRRRGCC